MNTYLLSGVVVLLLLDGFLAGARYILIRIHLSRHNPGFFSNPELAAGVQDLIDRYSRVEASLALFQTMGRVFAAGLFLYFLSLAFLQPWSWFVWLLLIGFAVLLAGLEWGASLLMMKDLEGWIARLIGPVRWIEILAKPIITPLLLLAGDVDEAQKKMDQVSEEELISLVDESQRDGFLEEDEQKMIHSVFRLDDTLTREIMVPRVDMLAIDATLQLPEAVKHFVDSGFSRIPVFEESIDNILGLLYAKDLLEIYSNGEIQGKIDSLLREAYFVPETKIINELLSDMQRKRIHQAIVVDEYGGVSGIVTLEDIIEEIFGEIQDEYDEEEIRYLAVGPGEYEFQGKIDIDDLNMILDSSLPNDEADTIGGLIYCRLGHVPKPGEVVKLDDLLIKVEQVDEHRIIKVRVKKLLNPAIDEEGIHDDAD